jgi:NadR type nicotinamide-nucleotide adenylyltransferase
LLDIISGKRRWKLLKKIAITGPESTGKSTLAQALANHFQTFCRDEYARDYLERLNSDYTKNDVEEIARIQLLKEQDLVQKCDNLLLLDTELLVIKIWMEHKYNNVPKWILNELEKQDYDLYLLCDIDIPWEEDPQREHPHLRKYFFEKYKSELEKYGFPFQILSGNFEERKKKAIELIDNKFSKE